MRHIAEVQCTEYRKFYKVVNPSRYVSLKYYSLNDDYQENKAIYDELDDINYWFKYNSPACVPVQEISEYVDVWSGYLNLPILNIGDKLFLESNGIEITIDNVVKMTSGKCIYKSKHKIKEVEDEKTIESKIAVQNIIEEYEKESLIKLNRQEELKLGLENLKASKVEDSHNTKKNWWKW